MMKKVLPGGIIGYLENGIVEKCSNYGNIEASAYTGGIVSLSNDGIIRNCINSGNINGNEQGFNRGSGGGILGENRGFCSIYNCYNIGVIKGKEKTGGIIGFNFERNITIKNCINFFEQELCGGKYVGNIYEYNCFYINQSDKYTKQYMMSKNFIEELNNYIEENAQAEEKWCKWVQGNNGYPTLDFNTV